MAVEERHAIELDGGDHLVHEAFTGGVHDIEAAKVFKQAATDGVHEMGFANADAAVDK